VNCIKNSIISIQGFYLKNLLDLFNSNFNELLIISIHDHPKFLISTQIMKNIIFNLIKLKLWQLEFDEKGKFSIIF
jgi:hypothetical protein